MYKFYTIQFFFCTNIQAICVRYNEKNNEINLMNKYTCICSYNYIFYIVFFPSAYISMNENKELNIIMKNNEQSSMIQIIHNVSILRLHNYVINMRVAQK